MNDVNEFIQIFDTVNIGLVILDRDLNVKQWNRWMEMHSNIPAGQITGTSILDSFPELNTPRFIKNSKIVLSFGNFAFLSQKLHKFLFPFKPDGSLCSRFEHMQQSCTMGPLRALDNSITGMFLIVQDVTEHVSYEQRLVEMNSKDGLTGIYNRRFLESRLNEEFERHRRYSRVLSLMMIDIDFFKKVNDSFGHQCGDAVLQTVAAKVSSVIRKTDVVARYGGEEFCCLLPETGLESAGVVAENVRIYVEEMETQFQDQTLKVTISIGFASMRESDTVETLIKRADEALYQAKHAGRNCVAGPYSALPDSTVEAWSHIAC